MEDNENIITFRGQEYPIVLTTKAVRDITRKYGSLDTLGDIFIHADKNQDAMFDCLTFLTYTLVNQSVLRHNFDNPDEKYPLITQDEIELFTGIDDLMAYMPVFTSIMSKGTKQTIKTEDSGKNVETAP